MTRVVTAGGRRTTAIVVAVSVVLIALVVLALTLGDYVLNPLDALKHLVVDDGSFAVNIVRNWRAPRVVAALVFGVALALSGAVFQSLTRNPLGSPDVIGFSTGSYTGALVVLIVVGGGYVSTSVGSLAGGLASAAVVYALSYRKGVQGFRLIIVGIAVTAVLSAVNTYLLLRAQSEVAMAASIWGAGSISLVSWDEILPVGVAIVVCVAGIVALAPSLRQLELGDDAAMAHGVRVERSRVLLLVVGVALTAAVTAVAGPIVFVSLAAPQVAKRLFGGPGVPLAGSALIGAFILLAADVVAQHALPGDVPVGMVTVVVGGVYLIATLIARSRRKA